MDGSEEQAAFRPHRDIPHYHGDAVRALFVFSALLLIVATSTRAALPLTTNGAVSAALILVIVAGITNPRQHWIHWVNAGMAVWGTFLFGTAAVNHYRDGYGILDPSFAYIEILALLFLGALYFTTRTIRGLLLRPRFR